MSVYFSILIGFHLGLALYSCFDKNWLGLGINLGLALMNTAFLFSE